jgi:excinuclease ABC subunit A
MYILDDQALAYIKRYRTINKILISLRNLGNTVIVVEHDEDIMKAADMIID